MREMFRAYYQPTPMEMSDLWNEGMVILDTNALLNLFRYSGRTRDDFFKALVAKTDSLWIPHQVGLEFHRRRITIINHQSKAFGDIEAALTKARGQAENALNGYKRHPSLDIGPMRAEFSDSISALIQGLRDAQKHHEEVVLATKTNDDILAEITDLYHGKVGEPFSQDKLDAIYREGVQRYDEQVPPGYKDATKNEPDRYGDLVLWRQILAHATEEKRAAIFVTDDQKEDWWYTVDSERHGARPELVEEYYVASGERVHFMTTDRFLDFAKSEVNDIHTESVDELERLSRDVAAQESYIRREFAHTWMDATDSNLPLPDSLPPRARQRLEEHPVYQSVRTELALATAHVVVSERAFTDALNKFSDEGPTPEILRNLDQRERELSHARADERAAQARMQRILHEVEQPTWNYDRHASPNRRDPELIRGVFDSALDLPVLAPDEDWPNER